MKFLKLSIKSSDGYYYPKYCFILETFIGFSYDGNSIWRQYHSLHIEKFTENYIRECYGDTSRYKIEEVPYNDFVVEILL